MGPYAKNTYAMENLILLSDTLYKINLFVPKVTRVDET